MQHSRNADLFAGIRNIVYGQKCGNEFYLMAFFLLAVAVYVHMFMNVFNMLKFS